MPSTTTYRRGDLVLVTFPFTDLSSSKKRPALVISPDAFSAANQDLVLAAITSQIADDRNAILIDAQDFQSGQLPRKSQIKLAKLFTIHSALILKRIATLNDRKVQECFARTPSVLFLNPGNLACALIERT